MEPSGDLDFAMEKTDWEDMVYTLKEAMVELLGDPLDLSPSPPCSPAHAQPLRPFQPAYNQREACEELTNLGAVLHAFEQQAPLMAPNISQPAQLCSEAGTFIQGQTYTAAPCQQHTGLMDISGTKRITELHPLQSQCVNMPHTETQFNVPGPSILPDSYYQSGRHDEWTNMGAAPQMPMMAAPTCSQLAQPSSKTETFSQGQQNLMYQSPAKMVPQGAPVTLPPPAAAALAHPCKTQVPQSNDAKQVPLSLQPAGVLNGQVLYALVPAASPNNTLHPKVVHRKKPEDDSNKPYVKKPLNAFMLFLKEQRAIVQAEFNTRDSAIVNTIVGEKWRSLSKEQVDKYFELAKAEAKLHTLLHPEWTSSGNYRTKRRVKRVSGAFASQNTAMTSEAPSMTKFLPLLMSPVPYLPVSKEQHQHTISTNVSESPSYINDNQSMPANLPRVGTPFVQVSVIRKVTSRSKVKSPVATPQAPCAAPTHL